MLPKTTTQSAKAARVLLAAINIKKEPVEVITLDDDERPKSAPHLPTAVQLLRQRQETKRQQRNLTLFRPEDNTEAQPSTSTAPPAPVSDSTAWADDDGALQIDVDPVDPDGRAFSTESDSDLEAEEALINNTKNIVLSDK